MAALADRALGTLPRLRQPSGLFCWEVADGDPAPRGASVRYTLIVLLGLLRARARGVEPPFDLTELKDVVDRSLRRPEVTPGDLGLALWVDARSGSDGAAELVPRLSAALDADGGLPAREGLELAWIVIGLASTAERGGGGKLAATMLDAALNQLLGPNRAESGLFRHFGAPGFRRRYPNFATEIYSVLALVISARARSDERALAAARRAADVLLGLQLPDGGWPWLYDVERARVVERYEVYSVHQHGMAPMALNELSKLSGDPRYTAAAQAGLPWLAGGNELGRSMFVPETGMTHRSIRRRRPFDRACLVGNVAAAATGRSPAPAGWALEMNRTCRPYELGWLIEAWGGRER
jgi:hypothetical protein